MQYKITKQYARDIEMPLAQFDAIDAARFFLKTKLEEDASLRVDAIYRLYIGGELLDEMNRGKVNVSSVSTRYFADQDMHDIYLDKYKVVAQDLAHSPEPYAGFVELKDTHLFIEAKLLADLKANKKITYRVLQNNQLLEKFDPAKPTLAEQKNKIGGASDQMVFRPTPFNTVPRPPGSPSGWIKEKRTVEEKAEE